MARQLNPSGIGYANLQMLIGVQDDGATVVDFVNAGNKLTADAPASQPISSGTYGLAFPIVSTDNYHTDGYGMSAAPAVNASSGHSITIFLALNGMTTAANGAATLMAEASNVVEMTIGFVAPETPTLAHGITANQVTSSTSLGLNTAHSVAITYVYNGAQAIYVDGVNAGSAGADGGNGSSQTPVRIGTLAGQGTFGAKIVYLAVFNTALTATQIANLHASLTGANAFSLILPPSRSLVVPSPTQRFQSFLAR